ncbi:MAG: hypothetical protein JW941_13655 [Candidatus Coatesbacteria bacterium]|nr:hypothetical protein [Candidatus Coatesbacteria bacterium]
MFEITQEQKSQILAEMNSHFKSRERSETGVLQVLSLWQDKDGSADDLKEFCLKYFIDDASELAAFRDKLELVFEKLRGHLIEIHTYFGRWKELELGPFSPQDELLARYNPFKHITDDFFELKLPFVILLNFKRETFESMVQNHRSWSREKWTEVRLANYESRVPAEVSHKHFLAVHKASTYVDGYNIFMNCLLAENGERLYEKEKRLISHWGLRDELKALYADPTGKPKQELILKVMKHIVEGTIPREIINNNSITWNPYSNECFGADRNKIQTTPEGERRYDYWFEVFEAQRMQDEYYTVNKTLIDRRFNVHREIPEAKVEGMFDQLLSSPVLGKVAEEMKARLGRDLRPYDIWYQGFKPLDSQAEMDGLVEREFPDVDAFNRRLPDILRKLGFSEEKAKYFADHIVAEPSRSAGHARGAAMRGANSLLRIRTEKGKLSHNAFNIAMHELGHTIEQTISMNMVDHTALEGVPNTAFTEAIAFLFQGKDKEVLGLPPGKESPEKPIHTYLSTCEIASMSLVDMHAWRYLYKNPDARPADLKRHVMEAAQMLWTKYWEPYFGKSDHSILGIYSHMITYYLYLPDYPIGHIISHQLENYFKTHELAPELERICAQGCIYPDLWMEKAVGKPISPDELLSDAEKAINSIG